MKRSLYMIAAILLASASQAERPVKKEAFVYSSGQAYILAWVGPMHGRKRFLDWLDFVRIDPETGKTLVLDMGELRANNARGRKDAGAVYYEATPWTIQDDKGLFLIPVNAGNWVIGSVNDTALSLGSYSFTLTPGTISYIGTVLVGKEDGSSTVSEIEALGLSRNGRLIAEGTKLSTIVLKRGSLSDLPADFPIAHVAAADITEDVRFNNYVAGPVSRAADLPPMMHAAPVAKADRYSYEVSLPMK